jgi:hypothetical protein
MMSDILSKVRALIDLGKVEVSLHAAKALIDDGLLIEPLILAFVRGVVVESYPNYHKGPCVLVLQDDEFGMPVHLLWGIPKGETEPAVLITAYRPDPERWTSDFKERRPA